MTLSSLPPQKTERAFRRYEPIIAKIVERFPNPVEVWPEHIKLSPVTFAARLRDAINSQREHQWPTTTVNMTRFMQVCDEIVVAQRETKLIIGSDETVRATRPSGQPWPEGFVRPLDTRASALHAPNVTINPSPDLCLAIATVLHHRIFDGPVRLVFVQPPPLDLISKLSNDFDIAVEKIDGLTWEII